MPFLVCSFLKIKNKKGNKKSKNEVQRSQESSTFPLPAASPAEIENSCRISLGNGKDCIKHVIGGEESRGPLAAGDPGPLHRPPPTSVGRAPKGTSPSSPAQDRPSLQAKRWQQ